MDLIKGFLSGGFGGMCLVFVGQPFDTIKVKLQTAKPGMYSGMLDCARKTGVKSLYAGMLAPLLGVPFVFATYFLGFEWGQDIAAAMEGVEKKDLSTAGICFAGGFSAIPGTTLMVPGDRIKVMLQAQTNRAGPPKYNGPIDAAKGIVRNEGFRGLYRGTMLTLARDGPGSVAYYGGYTILMRKLVELSGGDKDKLSVPAILTAGGLAGVCNWLVAVPPDTIKSRLQSAEPGRYPGGPRQIVSELIAKEGILSVYKGLGPALVRAFPANAACFMGVEVSRKFLDRFM